jgi:hypothetical protein
MKQITGASNPDSREILRAEIARTRVMAEELGGDAEIERALTYWQGVLDGADAIA